MMRARLGGLGRFAVRQPLGAVGAVLVLILIATAILAPRLAPHGPKDAAFAPYLPPSTAFPLGTDQLGRDVLSRVIWGARLSLYVGLASVVFGVTLGWLWGVVAAYVGGVTDTASQRVVDALMALPPIILALSLMAALGQSVNNVILALTILLTPTASRTLRALALSVRESPYVEAARAVGCPTWRVIVLHVLPNTFATYFVLVREHLVRHRGGGLAELSRPRRTARRAVLGRDADGWDASDGARALDVPLPGARDQPHEGWFFRDKKVMGYKPALTTYDNNTFMKVWLRE